MSDITKIEWADHTWSPWQGCTKVGPGCDHCYAEARDQRFHHGSHWGAGAERHRTVDWTKPRLWNRAAARNGVRRSVFPSLCDPFDNAVAPQWRVDLFALIAATPHLDWLLLTKRIGNAALMISETLAALEAAQVEKVSLEKLTWPWPNVWIGATLVNQPEHDRDIDKLRALSACVRFISYEPALGPLRLDRKPGIDWVIAGGESGPRARPMHPQWARDLRDQCAVAGVPFLFKQWGEWVPHEARAGADLGGQMRRGTAQLLHAEGNPDGFFRRGDAFVERIGKRAAGRLLDGVAHTGFPVSPTATHQSSTQP